MASVPLLSKKHRCVVCPSTKLLVVFRVVGPARALESFQLFTVCVALHPVFQRAVFAVHEGGPVDRDTLNTDITGSVDLRVFPQACRAAWCCLSSNAAMLLLAPRRLKAYGIPHGLLRHGAECKGPPSPPPLTHHAFSPLRAGPFPARLFTCTRWFFAGTAS